MFHRIPRASAICLTAGAFALSGPAGAAAIAVTVTIENLAPVNSVSFAPLRLGFGNGTFDAFNQGQSAGAAIVSIAEGGSASAWFPAFSAAEPSATLGSVGGALTPGNTASGTFLVDSAINRFFTFGTMVIPSNDLFLGNDSATGFQLLDADGNLLISSIVQRASAIWDAGSEIADPANAAFVAGGNNGLRTPQNGVVGFSFNELSAFNGLTTAAGYGFDLSALAADSDIYRISFSASPVPEPTTLALMAGALVPVGWLGRRRRADSRGTPRHE